MMSLEASPIQSLQSRLSAVSVHQSGGLIGSSELCQMCSVLVDGLRPFRGRRIALESERAEHVMITLAAAQSVGCELLLQRRPSIPEDLQYLWRISAVIDSSLKIEATGDEGAKSMDAHVLIATSGTTGEPKLAEHSLDSLLGRIRQRHEDSSRWLLTYHPATFAGLQVLLTAMAMGSELVTVTPPAIPSLCEAALSRQPTNISATPTFWRSLLLYLGFRAKRLRPKHITLGGEIADESILERLRTTFEDARIRHIYASTEAGAVFSVSDGHAGFPAQWLETGVDGAALRIRNGILEVQSPRTMKRYSNRDANSVITPDGWLVTGDLVEHVQDRVLFRGREDVTINVGGAKVRPEEVESVLLGLPEVMDACVYGVPNPLSGMVVGADVVLRPNLTASDIRPVIMTKLRLGLDSYKVPRVLRTVDKIEISASGKKERRL
jgi:acyl-coenzyme A synthetase/AMP-(fatty) acid ligase